MNVGPPPLPSLVRSEEPSAFARQASHACLAAPLIMIGLSVCVSSLSQNHRDASGRPLFLIFGLAEAGLFFVGALLGILAIALAKPGQRSSVILRAVCGLALLGLMGAIAVPNFVHARTLALQGKQSLEELHTAVADVRAQAVAALTNGGKTTVDAQPLLRSFNRAAENSSGDTAATLKCSQLFLKRMQFYQQAYSRAASELRDAKVITAADLKQRAQIAERKAVVQKFLDANGAFKTFLEQSESNFRKEMADAGISAPQAEAALKGFRRNWDAQAPLILSIREADDRFGHSMLNVLNLFDNQWGQWNYDAGAHRLRFQDRNALDQYNALMAEIKQAGIDQASTQKRLASVLSQPTASF